LTTEEAGSSRLGHDVIICASLGRSLAADDGVACGDDALLVAAVEALAAAAPAYEPLASHEDEGGEEGAEH